jgi:hypothetical protein
MAPCDRVTQNNELENNVNKARVACVEMISGCVNGRTKEDHENVSHIWNHFLPHARLTRIRCVGL